jgi:hypothetical protein
MQQDTLSESFSKLSTNEETPKDDTHNETDKKSVKSNPAAVDKVAMAERLKRLTKDPEQSTESCRPNQRCPLRH